ncbi:MAG: hypothetical protein HYZ16_11820 [Bacteroidetes bacterium]|jgi:hypothetical protein|nr:hypothetical protein [Bacteroidota bacterium]
MAQSVTVRKVLIDNKIDLLPFKANRQPVYGLNEPPVPRKRKVWRQDVGWITRLVGIRSGKARTGLNRACADNYLLVTK